MTDDNVIPLFPEGHPNDEKDIKDMWFYKEIVWNEDIEEFQFKFRENRIAEQAEFYLGMLNEGHSENFAKAMIESLSSLVPIYTCWCSSSDHSELRFAFTPCPCAECEHQAKQIDSSTSQPMTMVSIKQETVNLLAPQLQDVLKAFSMRKQILEKFIEALAEYNKNERTWLEICDDYTIRSDDSFDSDTSIGFIEMEFIYICLALTLAADDDIPV